MAKILYIAYHDEQWGVPVHDDRHLFESLIPEGTLARLSWLPILKKRRNYTKAFHSFVTDHKNGLLPLKWNQRILTPSLQNAACLISRVSIHQIGKYPTPAIFSPLFKQKFFTVLVPSFPCARWPGSSRAAYGAIFFTSIRSLRAYSATGKSRFYLFDRQTCAE